MCVSILVCVSNASTVRGAADSNIGGNTGLETKCFVDTLQAEEHVLLHGSLTPERSAAEYRRMDGFLIWYDIKKDQSKGMN